MGQDAAANRTSEVMSRRPKKAASRAAVPAPPPAASARARWLCALGVFIAILAVYSRTIIPTVVDQDSGELITAAHVLGVPHPTGYPLWTMLGRLFDLLPLGHTSAYRIALLSAVAAASGAAAITWLTLSLTGSALPGVFAGLSFGLWFPTWSQAVLAEVYGLTSLLFSLFLLALWRWDRERSPRRLRWLALAGGFVAMHHRTALLSVAPSLAAAFWLTRPRRARVWACAALLCLAPFSCYLYLPLRAVAHPAMNWGDPETLDRFLFHALGRQYVHLAFANSLAVAEGQVTRLLDDSLAGDGWRSWALAALGMPFIIWGYGYWCRRRPAIIWSLALGCVLLCTWVVEWGDTYDQKVFLIPLGAVTALLGGFGLARASALFPRRRIGHYFAAGLGALVCVVLLFANWGRADRSNTWRHRDQWAAVLAQMDENAIFIAESDNPVNVTYYLQNVEGMRKDVTLIEPTAFWSSWYAGLIADPELGQVSEKLWREITAQYDVHRSQGVEYGQCSAVLAARLAQLYRGRRTVYALHGPLTEPLPVPPYFVGLNQDLVRLDFDMPDIVRAEETTKPVAGAVNGAKLMSFEIGKKEADAGELVDFRARWRLDSVLQAWMFEIRLAPARPRSRERGDAGQARLDRLREKGLFVQGFKPVYGLWGLPPSSPGTAYEQRGKILIPSNVLSGRYTLEIGFAGPPGDDAGWTRVGSEGDLIVHARALPANGAW